LFCISFLFFFFFSNFSIGQAREILLNAAPRHYKTNDVILRKGTNGTEFFIIVRGVVSIADKDWSKNLVVRSPQNGSKLNNNFQTLQNRLVIILVKCL
jgi:hypothetical protein